MTEQQHHLLIEKLIREAPRAPRDYLDGLYDVLYKQRRATRTGCWEWTGGKNGAGYGQFRFQGKKWFAHRASWAVEHGYIPPTQLHVLHRCDNHLCFRPDHLFPGDDWINQRDSIAKGRSQRLSGTGNPHAKLTWESVAEVRARYAAGEDKRRLAVDYGVSPDMIYCIVTGKNWRVQ